MPAFATGIMRGRFGDDGALYTSGMFAWAGNAQAPGGFHRIRRGSDNEPVPIGVHVAKGKISVTFSETIGAMPCEMKVWSLLRSAKYGSQHQNEKPLTITGTQLSDDKRTLIIAIPDLAPTQCYELKIGDRVLHGTIHQLNP
jgi:hypothetical protein